MDGDTPPPKRDKNENPKHNFGDGRVGVDIGTRSVAISSEQEVRLQELAPKIRKIDKKTKRLQRKLDRSKKANNPDKYNEDGTINDNNDDPWVRSNNYMKTLFKLKDAYRKRKALREQAHNKLANYILSLGTEIYVEDMDFQALAKRAKETKLDEETGRFLSKKRFGESIGNKAPAKLLEIINRKLGYLNKELKKVDTWEFKASQYNHFADTYQKKELNDRWNVFKLNLFKEVKVQRDLYSAFLLMNSKDNLEEPDRNKCQKNFDKFKKLHDKEIKRLKNSNCRMLSSFGVKKAS